MNIYPNWEHGSRMVLEREILFSHYHFGFRYLFLHALVLRLFLNFEIILYCRKRGRGNQFVANVTVLSQEHNREETIATKLLLLIHFAGGCLLLKKNCMSDTKE